MLPVSLAHLPSWSQPLRLLISQTDSSPPAAPSRRPGAAAASPAAGPSSPHPSCTSVKSPSSANGSPPVRGRRSRRVICGKFLRQIFHMATRHPGGSTRVQCPPFSICHCHRPPPCSPELEPLISSVSETGTAFSPCLIFY